MKFSAMKLLCLGLVVALCASCIEIGRADNDASLSSGDDSYFVFGVQPDTVSIAVFRGSIVGDTFRQNPFLPANFYGVPQDGYIVSRAKAGETLAIAFITVRASKDAIFAQNYIPCGSSRTVVFSVPPGKVIYLADIQYSNVNNQLAPTYRLNIDSAKAYLATHYPELADKVEVGHYDFMHATGSGMICAR